MLGKIQSCIQSFTFSSFHIYIYECETRMFCLHAKNFNPLIVDALHTAAFQQQLLYIDIQWSWLCVLSGGVSNFYHDIQQ